MLSSNKKKTVLLNKKEIVLLNKEKMALLNKKKKGLLHIIGSGIQKGVIFAVLLLMMSVLSACGSEEDTPTMSASELVEEIPEGDVHTINAQTEGAAGEEQKGNRKANTTYKSETTKIEGETKEVKEISLSALEALSETENLTDEKRMELLSQALIDSGKDPSIAEGKFSTNGLYFEVPENFFLSESNPNMYVTRRYSLDISNIYYQESEVDYLLQLMTEESYREMALENVKEIYDMEVDLKIDSFEEIKISGIPSFQIESRFDLEGITIQQTTYIVNADKTYMLVYTTTDEYDTGLAFEDSIASIRVKK